MAILVLNIGDIISTDMSMARGGQEVNPVSGWLIENDLLPHAKMSIIAFIAVAAVAAHAHRKISNLLFMVAGFYFVVVGANSVQLLLHG
ncbi:MAG: DUF5658 family protein [Acidimicrobiales bacterium]